MLQCYIVHKGNRTSHHYKDSLARPIVGCTVGRGFDGSKQRRYCQRASGDGGCPCRKGSIRGGDRSTLWLCLGQWGPSKGAFSPTLIFSLVSSRLISRNEANKQTNSKNHRWLKFDSYGTKSRVSNSLEVIGELVLHCEQRLLANCLQWRVWSYASCTPLRSWHSIAQCSLSPKINKVGKVQSEVFAPWDHFKAI